MTDTAIHQARHADTSRDSMGRTSIRDTRKHLVESHGLACSMVAAMTDDTVLTVHDRVHAATS